MSRTSTASRLALRRALAVGAALAATAGLAALPAGSTAADLQNRINGNVQQDRQLRQGIGADAQRIHGYQGRIDDLRARLSGLESVLSGEQQQLNRLQSDLRDARARLTKLRFSYVRDRRVLARQLVSQYEAPKPSLVDVILQAHGFADLLELADRFKAVASHNAAVAHHVKSARSRVTRQATRLATLETQQAQITRAAQAQRDSVAQLKLAVVEHQLRFVRARSAKSVELQALRSQRGRLRKQLAKIQATQYASITGSGASGMGPGLPPGGAPPWSPHGGAYGFFQAPGTNYSVGDTPRLAANLDVMGKALHLHLIGLSGYRTPQHSVEVGGFANDPHTRGEASDTPGLEGVPEATLNHYGLTRPFGGVAELDHVQLVGSI